LGGAETTRKTIKAGRVVLLIHQAAKPSIAPSAFASSAQGGLMLNHQLVWLYRDIRWYSFLTIIRGNADSSFVAHIPKAGEPKCSSFSWLTSDNEQKIVSPDLNIYTERSNLGYGKEKFLGEPFGPELLKNQRVHRSCSPRDELLLSIIGSARDAVALIPWLL
jgi:hypothetical protein